MAKLLHEIWRADGDCAAITCCLAGPMGDQARAMLEPGAYLLQVFWAGSQLEAGTIRNKILGFEPYRSEWEAIDNQPYPEDRAFIKDVDIEAACLAAVTENREWLDREVLIFGSPEALAREYRLFSVQRREGSGDGEAMIVAGGSDMPSFILVLDGDGRYKGSFIAH
jgi:hypothetical protein